MKVTILESHLQELAKRCTCNILILIFSLDFDKQCQMCKKSSSRCLRVEFLGDVKKSDFLGCRTEKKWPSSFAHSLWNCAIQDLCSFLRVNIPSWDALLLCNINSESTRYVDKQCHQVRKGFIAFLLDDIACEDSLLTQSWYCTIRAHLNSEC